MNNSGTFDLYVCPQCGKITVMPNNGKCPYCQISMTKYVEGLNDAFIDETAQNINKIFSQHYKKHIYNKKLWKNREKNDLNIIKSHGKIVWNESLKKNIRICPKCSNIVTNNYLMNINRCISCDIPYVDLKITGFDYYYPELKGEGYIYNKIKAEKEKLGIYNDIALPNKSTKNIDTDLPTLGIIPSLLIMPNKIAEAKERLSKFMGYYLPVVKTYCEKLDKDMTNDILLGEFSYVVSHIHNVLRGQRFLGQEMSVNFWILLFIEIEQKYFRTD